MAWHVALGIRPERMRFHQHGPDELAHYARAAYDIEYEFPFGWNEFEGIHDRTDFDLARHQQASGKKLEYFDEIGKERYLPYIVETSVGCDRFLLVSLVSLIAIENALLQSERLARRGVSVTPVVAAKSALGNGSITLVF